MGLSSRKLTSPAKSFKTRLLLSAGTACFFWKNGRLVQAGLAVGRSPVKIAISTGNCPCSLRIAARWFLV